MRILLDTNRYTDFCKSVPEAVAPVTAAEHVFLPFAALALQHNLALLSRDAHFDNLPQLRRA